MQNSPAGQMGAGVEGCGGPGAQPQPSVQSTAVFQGGVVGPFVAESIVVAEESATVGMMAALKAVTQNCSRFGGDMPGGVRMDIAIDELTFPRVGDEVLAFRLTGSIPGAGAAVFAHVVTTRIGRIAVTVILMQLSSPDVATTEAIVRPAVDKAGRLLPK
jgi:hypothetical protein